MREMGVHLPVAFLMQVDTAIHNMLFQLRACVRACQCGSKKGRARHLFHYYDRVRSNPTLTRTWQRR